MKKRILGMALVICLLAAFIPVAAHAASGTCGDNLSWELDADGVLTISGTGDMKEIYNYGQAEWDAVKGDIKALVVKGGVTSIADYAFWDCQNLTQVSLPQSLVSIGKASFLYCENISSLKLPPNVESIGDWAFVHCKSMREIHIPKSVATIGETVFEGCEALEDIYYGGSGSEWGTITWGSDDRYPEGIRIHYDAASGTVTDEDGKLSGTCGESLSWVLDASGVLTISGTGDMTDFEDEMSMPWFGAADRIQHVKIEPGVTGVGNYAFTYCYYIEDIELSPNLVRIGDYAFEGCFSARELFLPASIQHIGADSFMKCHFSSITVEEGCTAYQSQSDTLFNSDKTTLILYATGKDAASYNIPEGVKTVANGAFFGGDDLKSVTIPDGVRAIGQQAFQDCRGLTEIRLPHSLKTIGYWAFYDCTSVKDVYYDGTRSDWDKVQLEAGDTSFVGKRMHFNDNTTGEGTAFFEIGEAVGEGTCGPDLYWQKDSSGTLLIYGIGSTYDFRRTGVYNVGDDDFFPTWIFQSPPTRRVVISSGVTGIGRCAFTDVPDIIKKSFHVYLGYVTDIYYEGTEEEWLAFAENISNSYNEYLDGATVHTNIQIRYAGDEPEPTARVSEPTVDGRTVTFTVTVSEEASAWFAVYDDGGRLIDVEYRPLTVDEENELAFTADDENASGFCLFVLDEELIPLCREASGGF